MPTIHGAKKKTLHIENPDSAHKIKMKIDNFFVCGIEILDSADNQLLLWDGCAQVEYECKEQTIPDGHVLVGFYCSDYIYNFGFLTANYE